MTTVHSVTIDEDTFMVSEADIDSVRAALVEAARGAAFVSFDIGPQQRVEVLVTPARSVRIQHRTLEEEPELPEPIPLHEPAPDWLL